MALSKPLPSVTKVTENVSEKINEIPTREYNGSLHPEEIIAFCKITKEKPVSIELIHNLLGGPNMEYSCMELQNSLDCYQFCRNDLIKKLQETKYHIEFFEARITSDANVIVSVIKKPKKNGKGDQIVLMCVIRMTLFVTPKVGYCHYFDLTGSHVFTVFSFIYY